MKLRICKFTENFQHIPISLHVGLFETCVHTFNVTHIPEDVNPYQILIGIEHVSDRIYEVRVLGSVQFSISLDVFDVIKQKGFYAVSSQ